MECGFAAGGQLGSSIDTLDAGLKEPVFWLASVCAGSRGVKILIRSVAGRWIDTIGGVFHPGRLDDDWAA